MKDLLNTFNNREIAVYIWSLVFIFSMVLYKPVRRSIPSLFIAFFKLPIILSIVTAFIYTSIITLGLYKLNFWNVSHLKDTFIWFMGSAIIILYRSISENRSNDFFKILLLDNLKLILMIEFIYNSHQFSLISELIITFVMTLLSLLLITSKTRTDYRPATSFLQYVIGILVLIVLYYSITNIIESPSQVINLDSLTSFLLPILLSILFIPCAYGFAIYSIYESLLIRLKIYLPQKKSYRHAKKRILKTCKLNLKKLKLISPKINSLYTTASIEHIDNTLKLDKRERLTKEEYWEKWEFYELLKDLHLAAKILADFRGGYSGKFLSAEEFHTALIEAIDDIEFGNQTDLTIFWEWFAPTCEWDDFVGEAGIELGNKIFERVDKWKKNS